MKVCGPYVGRENFSEGFVMPSGRIRQFDLNAALDRAMEVFWKRGYEGATLEELTAAMGINRPSLYATFGNKEQLFRKALDRYGAGPTAFVREALAEPTARGVVESIFRGMMRLMTDAGHPQGCMVVHGALVGGEESECIRGELAQRREAAVCLIRERFERAEQEGDLPKGTDCGVLARYVATIMHGLAVQAVSGAAKEELQRVAELVMRVWPE
jgi:AcrR family transcriptional regulator